MLMAEIPKNEDLRIEGVRKLKILDSEAELIYDELVDLAAKICEVPIALISVVDQNRLWLKAKKGLLINEIPRDISFCSHAILSDAPLLVVDATQDPRFAQNPLVTGGPRVRFYGGFPLKLKNGLRIGSLCVIDQKTKVLSEVQLKSMLILKRQIEAHLEARAVEQARAQLQSVIESQKEKMNASAKMAALGEMAAGVAHEINNPLAAILAWSAEIANLAEQNFPHPEKIGKMANSIERIGLRISRTIKALQTFSRAEKQAELQKCSLQNILEETLDLCRYRFQKGGVQLKFEPCSENFFIDCRPTEISQVLLNLLNNAYDAVNQQSEKWVRCRVQAKGNSIEILVQDAGLCPSPEIQEKIMSPFFTTKPPGEGTGLGLSISQRIVHEHGGSLRLEPKEFHTQFVLQLPLVA